MPRSISGIFPGLFGIFLTTPALAQESAIPAINSGDTAWMLVASAFVLMMTLPGLALFYGGLVRRENVLATLMQSLSAACLASLLWVTVGYSLAFGGNGWWIGDFSKAMLNGIALNSASGTIPESVFVMFQLTFAAITPALIFGAVAERMRFSAMFLFTGLWLLAVYVPVAHWVWGPGGFIGGTGTTDYAGLFGFGLMLDFAGGTVVHVNAGVAGLVAALVLGKRRGYGAHHFLPHNLILSVVGACLLWIGWFGFNAGSALAAGSRAGMAVLVTHIAASAAALSWMGAEWVLRGKPSMLGLVSGAVAGLVAITPASGFVGIGGALAIGLIAGGGCFWAASSLKHRFDYDDSLDVFGIHGVGGIIGSVLTGVFAVSAVGGVGGALEGNWRLVFAQTAGTLVVIFYSAFMTWLLLKLTSLATPLRVDAETESTGLDLALHGERVP